MERRTVIFVLLSLTIWYGWLSLFPPPTPVEPTDPVVVDGSKVPAETPAAPQVQAPVVHTTIKARQKTIAFCGIDSEWSNQGGGLSKLDLMAFKAPYTVTPAYQWVLGGFGPWKPYGDDPGPVRVLSEQASGFAIGAGSFSAAPVGLGGGPSRASGTDGVLTFQQSFREVPGEPCTIALSYTWTNPGSTVFAGPLWISVHDGLPEGGGMMARYTSQASAMTSIDASVWTLTGYDEITDATLVDEGKVDWFGVGDRYFAAYAVPSEPHGQMMQSRRTVDGVTLDGMHWVARTGLGPGESHTEEVLLYVGVKDMDILAAANPALENSVELGWFGFFGGPLLWLLKQYHSFVGNWGVAIILLTVTIKAVFFPLTQSAFRSGQAMQSIQPMLAKIKEEYADDPQEVNRRTVELFREYKVNPVGGCLPMVLQIPVWIALYNVLLSSVELYQTEFLYLRDLSSVDPYCVLPTFVIAVMVVQQRFTPTANMDPMQAQMMKMMPLIFGLFFFTLPAGLVVYMFVNMVLSVLQQWFIKRTFVTPEPATAG